MRIPGLFFCPDCEVLLLDPGHPRKSFTQPCDCFACMHLWLFVSIEGRSMRDRLGQAACDLLLAMEQERATRANGLRLAA